MRVLLSSAAFLVLSSLAPVLASDAPAEAPFVAGSPSSFHGELAFSDTIAFDYDRDGTLDKVQFWIELHGQQAIGEPGSPGARPESGSVSYFVVDVARKRRIDNWLLGLNMAGGFPVAGEPYPLVNISITERTVQFELSG